MKRQHWVNDKCAFEWEIVLNGFVVEVMDKEFDDDDDDDMKKPTNRKQAERRARFLNRKMDKTMKRISKPQQIQIDRLRMASYNEMDGNKVADTLIDNRNLWDAFVFGRFGSADLIELRDLEDGYLNADTLLVLTDKKRWLPLLEKLENLKYDEIGYIAGDGEINGINTLRSANELHMAMGGGVAKNQILVRVWWD